MGLSQLAATDDQTIYDQDHDRPDDGCDPADPAVASADAKRTRQKGCQQSAGYTQQYGDDDTPRVSPRHHQLCNCTDAQAGEYPGNDVHGIVPGDRKSTRLNSSH